MSATRQDVDYVLGHSQSELARLTRQAEFFADSTEQILIRAGLGPGMRVLDLGCGVGDVSLLAAKLVGPTGSVVGIDQSIEALSLAERRAHLAGFDSLRFEQKNIGDISAAEDFNAVIGRFILLHLNAPETTLRHLRRVLNPDCLLVFAEMDIRSAQVTPKIALLDKCLHWIIAVYRCAGLEPDMGSNLYGVFRAAGLTPELYSSCRIQGGANEEGLSYVAETIRSMLPTIVEFNIADKESIGIETLADRLVSEAAEGEHCIVFPRLVGAWAKVSQSSQIQPT